MLEWGIFSPVWSHVLSLISPWAHLLKRGSSKSECLLTMWLRNNLNLAQMIFPFPLGVVVALQWRWFVHGFIHSLSCSLSFSFASFEISFLISVYKLIKTQKSLIYWREVITKAYFASYNCYYYLHSCFLAKTLNPVL